MAEGYQFDLARMTPEARALWLSAYEVGYGQGIDAGRRQLEAEWRGSMEVSAAIARQVAASVPFDELAERRGQPARAERQRDLLRERGVA